MVYCQRCGRQIDGSKTHCPYCGVLQERDLAGEKKACRKCEEQIPVNANYCPYCGHDQAVFDYRETPREETTEHETDHNIGQEKKPADLGELLEQIRQENESYVKQRQEEAKRLQRERPFGKNETKEPGLIPSTKLMLRDSFKLDKRMGRADFWWGYLGVTMLTMLLTIPAALIVSIWQQISPNTAEIGLQLIVYVIICFYVLEMFTSLVRRFRDAEIPVILVILSVTGIGELICLLLATRPQKITNLDYTFQSRSKRR